MAVAATSGRLDYSKANSFDAKWLLRERITLEILDNERMVRVFESWNSRQLAMMIAAFNVGDSEHGSELYDMSVKLSDCIETLLLPYQGRVERTEADHYRNEISELRAAWERKFGMKLDDPETKAYIREKEQEGRIQQAKAKQAALTTAMDDAARTKIRTDYYKNRRKRRPKKRRQQ